MSDAMLMLAALKHVAWILEEPVYVAGDDARNYFNQQRLHPSQWPLLCTLPDTADNKPLWIANYIMEFGLTPASNIAQRLAINWWSSLIRSGVHDAAA